MKIGAQLYTVRDFCKSADAFSETLSRIADIGYEYVQVSGTCEYDAVWLDSELKKSGLSCVITHTPAKKLVEETDKVINDHSLFGCKYIGLGYYGYDTPKEKLASFLDTYTPVAERLAASGKYFMYHNHAAEFQKIDSKTVLEHIAERTAPSILGFTLDTYWVQVGGANPCDVLEMLSGRVPCIHLKDYAFGQKMAVLGEGNINFDRVFVKAEEAKTKYMLVEQDDCGGEDPFDCLKRSYEFLKSRGF